MQIPIETVAVTDVGSQLANGATVIKSSNIHLGGDGMIAHGIVLAVTRTGQYATWMLRLDTGNTHGGNYFVRLDRALLDFEDRVKAYGLQVIE